MLCYVRKLCERMDIYGSRHLATIFSYFVFLFFTSFFTLVYFANN
jgi:hypothetical protein